MQGNAQINGDSGLRLRRRVLTVAATALAVEMVTATVVRARRRRDDEQWLTSGTRITPGDLAATKRTGEGNTGIACEVPS